MSFVFLLRRNPNRFKLEEFTKNHSTDSVRAIALNGRFVDKIRIIDEYVATVGSNPFKLVFLDQKGWAAAPMSELESLVGTRPCELLFNVMTSFLTRFVDRETLAGSYHSFFGRAGVIEELEPYRKERESEKKLP